MGFAVDAGLPSGIKDAAGAAAQMERLGFDGLFSTETASDPFLDLAVPAASTESALLYTNLAIAFARSPFVTAINAWQLQAASGGRFALGLGTQVKGHIERRFGLNWESPGPRFREYVQALKELFAAFQSGGMPQHRGRYYTHTLLTPFFRPPPLNCPAPPVWIAAVNEYNAETAGLVADGLLVHPVHSRKYLDEVLLPAVDRGLAKAGRTRADVTIVVPVFLVAGAGDGDRESAASFVRTQVSFYGSTRTYRRIFETHGWDDTPTRLHELMARGDFGGMAEAITDEMIDTFAITGHPDEIPSRVLDRYKGVADRLYFYNVSMSPPYAGNEGLTRELVSSVRAS